MFEVPGQTVFIAPLCCTLHDSSLGFDAGLVWTVELGFQQFEEHFAGVWTVLLLVWKNSLRRVYAPRYLTITSYPTVYLLVKHSKKHQPT